MSGAQDRNRVFISYSRRDKRWLDDLKIHLEPLVRDDRLAVWDDMQIKAGEKWYEEIQKALSATKVAVLLVSPNFLASDFIARHEFPELLKAAKGCISGPITVMWVAVSASSYTVTQINDYQAANDPKRPLDSLPQAKRNQVWVEIAQKIMEAAGRPGCSSEPQPETEESVDAAAGTGRVVLLYKHRSQPDVGMMEWLERALSDNGFPVYVDRHARAGLTWGKQIADQIRQAEAVIPLLSAGSVGSEMFSYEVHMAHEAAQQRGGLPRLLPVRLCYAEDLPDSLSDISPLHHVQWEGPEDNQRLLRELLTGLRNPVPAPPRNLRPRSGAVPLDDEYYVERATDKELSNCIDNFEGVILVKGPRQSGKTSLPTRGRMYAKKAGAEVFYTDFQKLNSGQLSSLETMYRNLLEWMADELNLPVPVESIWNAHMAPNRNLERYLKREVLPKRRLFWVMDEVERLFQYEWAGEFFALIRSWYNDRSDPESPWVNLTVAIAYATDAYLFIPNMFQSPFNVGVKLELNDFTREQVDELNNRHGNPLRSWAGVKEFYNVVGGQPFLVRRGLYELTRPGQDLGGLIERSAREDGPFGDHLHRILTTLARNEGLCEAVARVLNRHGEFTDDHFFRLQRAGVFVGSSRQSAAPRCPLYAEYLRRHLLEVEQPRLKATSAYDG